VAAALLPVWLAPSSAEQCRIGPVAFEAPACAVEKTAHGEGPASYAQWQEGETIYTVVVVTARKPISFKGYLGRWLYQRKCSAAEIPFGHELGIEGVERSIKPDTPPQITWKGTCVAPEKYMVRAIGLKRQVVELHVTLPLGDPAPIEGALAAFLDRVRLYPAE
jgi:hypothetical protein